MVVRYVDGPVDWGGERVVFGKPASEPEYHDTVLQCAQCKYPFYVNAEEQRFRIRHGRTLPRFCRDCRVKHQAQGSKQCQK